MGYEPDEELNLRQDMKVPNPGEILQVGGIMGRILHIVKEPICTAIGE